MERETINFGKESQAIWLSFLLQLRSLAILCFAVSISLPITFPWTVLVVGIFVSLAIILTSVHSKDDLFAQLKDLQSAPLTKPIVIFAMAVTVSGLINGGLSEGLKSLLALRGMLVYFWAYDSFYIRSLRADSLPDKEKEQAVSVLLVVGALAGLWGTVEQITGFHPFSFHYLQGTGFLSGPMAFAGLAQIFSMLAFGMAYGGAFLRLRTPLSNYILMSLVVLGNFLGVIFAGERSAWLGAFIALALSSLFISRRFAMKITIGLLLALVLIWLTVPLVHQRIMPLFNWQEDVSARVRITLWQHALAVFERSPLFGIGVRQFPRFVIPEALGQGHPVLDHAHSNYLQILATTGLVGLSAYLYLYFSALQAAYLGFVKRSKDRSIALSPDQGICFGIFASTIALLISGIFEFNFGTGQIRLCQWFLFGMLGTNCLNQQTKNNLSDHAQ